MSKLDVADMRAQEQVIDAFLDDWNRRRQNPYGAQLFAVTSAEEEAKLPSSQRTLFRQIMGSFVDRFRPNRRDFHKRLAERDPPTTFDDVAISQTLDEMGNEALKRHLGVALSPEDAARLLQVYRMSFTPPLKPVAK